MESRQYRIYRQFTQFSRFSPFVCNALQFCTGNRNDGTMTRMEIHLHRMIYHFEVFQVGCFRELISSLHVYIVHQNVLVLSNQFERTGSFHRFLCLLFIVRLFFPFSGSQRTSGCHFNTVTVSFRFIEKMVYPVFIHDITVYTRLFVLRDKKRFRFSFQVRKIFIGIRIINYVYPTGILHRPVDHVLPYFLIINSLRSPYTFQLFLPRITFLYINDRVRPVYQVSRFQQHHCPVRIPTIIRHHIGQYHIKSLTVFSSQDMRVAHATGRTDYF